MKKLLFWMVLIVGILALIGSCAKKEESTTAATAAADNTTSTTSTTKYMSTTTTASGSITMGDDTLSGVYASECLTSASTIAFFKATGFWASEVNAYGQVFVVTGSDNISIELYAFTDTSCSNMSQCQKTVSDNVTFGSASGSNYPVTYNNQTQALTVHTTAAETALETLYSNALDFIVGTPI